MKQLAFKQLLGHRVYLEMPSKEEESKLILNKADEEQVEKEWLSKMSRLKVVAVGHEVKIEELVPGAEVLVEPQILMEKSKVVPIGDEKVILVSAFDIVHIW